MADIASFPVTRGAFVINIITTGEVIAENSVTISAPSNVRSSLQIVALALEGSRVKKSDMLIMFDTSDIDTRIEERDATYQQALEDIEKLKAMQASKMASLMSTYEVTKNNYELSKIRLKRMEYEAETRQQMEELNFKNAEINLKKLEDNIKNEKIINSVDMQNAKLKIERAKRDLDEAIRDRERLIVRAPNEGLVVYKEDRHSATREKIKVGDTPHRRMPLLELPDLSVMQIKTFVNEIDIRKIKKGQKTVIRLDAVQNAVFVGEITDIAYLARREKGTNVKVFDIY
ncbi:HlyD family efflux transporter periplasmic adaptor subunit, partial [bacterium]|nr:HlyD family efflux transporter periplasmic adaptor subunit [bacterium]